MNAFKYLSLAHLHVIVNDLDEASSFYREVMGCIEMQSHLNLINRGLGTYYGFEEIWDRLEVSLRFMVLPGVVTLKLIKWSVKGYGGTSGTLPPNVSVPDLYASGGLGPISLFVDDLDAAYTHFLTRASDYGSKHRISLLSPPVFMSPLLPHQTGASPASALAGQEEILRSLADRFPERAKFQLVDPFGVRWEFNNALDIDQVKAQ